MSIDYDAYLAFGFVFDMGGLDRDFGMDLPRDVKREERWDPKTGEKLEDAEIVYREAGRFIVFNDTAFDPRGSEIWEMMNLLSEEVGGRLHMDGNFYDGSINFFVIGPGDVDVDSLSTLDPVMVEQARSAASRLETQLRDLGLEISGPAAFHAVGTVS